jgi:hypothetical protein
MLLEESIMHTRKEEKYKKKLFAINPERGKIQQYQNVT